MYCTVGDVNELMEGVERGSSDVLLWLVADVKEGEREDDWSEWISREGLVLVYIFIFH